MLNELNSSAYEISPETMALIAIQNENGTVNTRVLEENHEYVASMSPTKIIDKACLYFGSCFNGRLNGTKEICGFNYKAPVSVNPIAGMYFFPTNSPNDKQCSWLSHSHIKNIVLADEQKSKVIFKNGSSITFNISLRSLTNQLYRTAQYRYLLDERLFAHMKRKNNMNEAMYPF